MRVSRPSHRFALLPLLWALSACAAEPGGAVTPGPEHDGGYVGEAWPEADALFHTDPDFLGGDGAHSVALPGSRTLWLFGDSFIAADPAARTRRQAVMVRNSVALMTGDDPTGARMDFYWRHSADGAPASFFPERDDAWFWPADGLHLQGALTLILHRLRPAPGTPLGFAIDGFELRRVDALDPETPPGDWVLSPLQTTAFAPEVLLGVTLVADGDHVYLFGVRETARHEVVLLRYGRADFVAGDLAAPSLWGGAEVGWDAETPGVVVQDGATEFSVGHLPNRPGWALVYSRGFGATQIAMRTATALTGPFSAPVDLYTPPESRGEHPFVYAGKAHDQLRGAPWVATYAANAFNFGTLLDSPELYFPRFVRLSPR